MKNQSKITDCIGKKTSLGNNTIVSVIVPVYNVQKYLKRCVDSILSQSYKNIEVILIDDGSTDSSPDLCDAYARLDARVCVIHQNNFGQAVARNRGINIAKGEWLAFVDSDDWIDSSMIERLLDVANQTNADIVSSGVNVINSLYEYDDNSKDGSVFVFSPDDAIFDLFRQKMIRFEIWNKLWRKSVVGNHRFKKGQLCEEVKFDFAVFYESKKIAYLNIPLYNYVFQRMGNTNSSFRLEKFCVFEEFNQLQEKYIESENLKLSRIMSCIGTKFAIDFYISAVGSHQPKNVLLFLKEKFRIFFRRNPLCVYNTKKEFLQLYLFYVSPVLYSFLFMLKNKKRK